MDKALTPGMPQIQQTKLNPLEEALFQTWARAHGIKEHTGPNAMFDYRGYYKDNNGRLHQPNELEKHLAAHLMQKDPVKAYDSMLNGKM